MFSRQQSTEVLQWQHRSRRAAKTRQARETACDHWQYAALSANVYDRSLSKLSTTDSFGLPPKEVTPAEAVKPNALSHWERIHFLDRLSARELLERGVYVEAFRSTEPFPRIAVVFEGTTGDRWSLRANAKWFLRFVPGPLIDSYSIVGSTVVQKLHACLLSLGYSYDPASQALLSPEGQTTKLVATGHSLGGGLAQYFAYTFNQAIPRNPWTEKPFLGPKVSEVFAFNTTPVTGWYAAPNPPRDHNVAGLIIHRIFEHGDFLSYLRLVTSRLIPGGQANPEIIEYRYNFLRSVNIILSHSIREMSEQLKNIATSASNQ